MDNIDLLTINGTAYPPVIPADTLSAVLTAGNNAGASDIDMNNNDILNVDNIDLLTINGTAYPPVVPADTLSAVLTAGNTATNSIALNNTGIGTNVISLLPNATTNNPHIELTDGTTTNVITKNGMTTRNSVQNSTHYLNFSDTSATGTGAIQKTTGIECNPSTKTITATNFVGDLTGNATTATNIGGGAGGSIPYQIAVNTTALLANGTAGQVLTSQGTTLAPTWTTLSGATAISVTDTNTNSLFYPTFVSASGINQTLRADITTTPFSYNPSNSTLTATTFTGSLNGNATTATNISGGAGGSIPYQSAVNTTALLANGTAGQVLTSQGTTLAPIWTTPSIGNQVTATLSGIVNPNPGVTLGTLSSASLLPVGSVWIISFNLSLQPTSSTSTSQFQLYAMQGSWTPNNTGNGCLCGYYNYNGGAYPTNFLNQYSQTAVWVNPGSVALNLGAYITTANTSWTVTGKFTATRLA